MIKLLHMNPDLDNQMVRNIRSPMTPSMVNFYNSVGNISYKDFTDEQKAGGLSARMEGKAERVRLVREYLSAGGYTEVAHVAGDDMDYCYAATQNGNLSESWSQNAPANVTPVGETFHLYGTQKYGRKSTDVGDLLIVNDKYFVVDSVGFTEL